MTYDPDFVTLTQRLRELIVDGARRSNGERVQ